MSDKTWVLISEIPAEWWKDALFHTQGDELPIRARRFIQYKISDEDFKSLQDQYGSVSNREYERTGNLPKHHFEEWWARNIRTKAIVPHNIGRKILDSEARAAGFFNFIDWGKASCRLRSGEKNIYGDQPGYAAIGIEFDYGKARELGMPEIASVEAERRGAASGATASSQGVTSNSDEVANSGPTRPGDGMLAALIQTYAAEYGLDGDIQRAIWPKMKQRHPDLLIDIRRFRGAVKAERDNRARNTLATLATKDAGQTPTH